MNKILLFIALSFSTTLFGQTLDGFMGIKFGTPIEIVKKTLLSIKGCNLSTKSINEVDCYGINFKSYNTEFLQFKFIDGKFYNGHAIFVNENASKTLEFYKKLKNDLNLEYYNSNLEHDLFLAPFTKNDGNTEQALEQEKASFLTDWKLGTDSNIIELGIVSSKFIDLSYVDYPLWKIASNSKNDSKPVVHTLEGFMGVKFGSSIEIAKKIMASKEGYRLSKFSNSNTLYFQNSKFANRDAVYIWFLFVDNMFYSAGVQFTPQGEGQLIKQYNEIRDELTEKYFTPSEVIEHYDSPYEKDDGSIEIALMDKKALLMTYWKFNNLKSKDGTQDEILLTIKNLSDYKSYVMLIYNDKELTKIARKKETEKINKDY